PEPARRMPPRSFRRRRCDQIHVPRNKVAKKVNTRGSPGRLNPGQERESSLAHRCLELSAPRSGTGYKGFSAMQLREDILGGLPQPPPPTRREKLARDGEAAQAKVQGVLRQARSRALRLSLIRICCVALSGLLIALLASAAIASRGA